MINVAYIYEKDGKHRVYNHRQAEIHHDSLIKNGWLHKFTVDIFIWAENQLNKKSPQS